MVTNCFPLLAQWDRADSLVVTRVLEKHWVQRELSLFMAPLTCVAVGGAPGLLFLLSF